MLIRVLKEPDMYIMMTDDKDITVVFTPSFLLTCFLWQSSTKVPNILVSVRWCFSHEQMKWQHGADRLLRLRHSGTLWTVWRFPPTQSWPLEPCISEWIQGSKKYSQGSAIFTFCYKWWKLQPTIFKVIMFMNELL